VTLAGPGGTGKTRLGLQVAAELVDDFKNGVFWVPLAALSDPSLVVPTIGQTLGAKDGLAEHIEDQRLLLLLDNFEQLLPAAPVLADLLARCPNVKLLVTSRAVLRVRAEHEYQVPPLPETDAVMLFVDRARVVKPGFDPDDAVAEVCRRLDGLPLAIELAAARIRVLSSRELLERLARRLPLLTGGPSDAPERQRTLRATIEWSYDLLDEDLKRLFGRVAIFPGSWTLEAAEEICGADLDLVSSLIENSLVRRWESGRFGMLETIREFAVELLDRSREADALAQRHAEYYLALAESANLADEADSEMNPAVVMPERDNLRAALEWCLESGQTELGLRLTVALDHFWVASAPYEGQRWCAAFLDRAADVPRRLRAHALRTYGGLVFIVGEFERGERLYAESLAESRAIGDDVGAAHTLLRLPMAALVRGDVDEARALAEEGLAAARRLGRRKGEAVALGSLGEIAVATGERERALELLRTSADLAGEAGFVWWQAGMLLTLGDCALQLARLDAAESALRQGVELALRIDNRMHAVYGLALLARIAADRGATDRAGVLWGAIEADEERGPIGQWEEEREAYAAFVLAVAGDAFEAARTRGRRLSLAEAVEYALGDA
jgi:predicted ATPase